MNNYSNKWAVTSVPVKRIRRFIYRMIFFPVKITLSFIEKIILYLLNQKDALDCPVVFIIGPPRSGTTLLYQVLVNRYVFTYFSNFTARFYLAPVFAFWLAKFLPFDKDTPDEYRSKHGQTERWHGPHEAGNFWYRWFPTGEHIYVPRNATPQSILYELRREVSGIIKITKAPLLFKNTFNSMRIAPIVEAFPKAIFLVCHRDPVDTAQSILKGRMDKFDCKDQWWSLPPRQIDEIRQHPYWEQVVEQVYYTYKQVSEDKNKFGADRFYDVHYEQLCADPIGTLANLEEFLANRGLCLDIQGDIPPKFSVSTGQRVSDEDYQHITRKVHELWG